MHSIMFQSKCSEQFYQLVARVIETINTHNPVDLGIGVFNAPFSLSKGEQLYPSQRYESVKTLISLNSLKG